jgi:hypothetical protein
MGGGGERYWDGIAWSEHFTRPSPAAAAPFAPSPPGAPVAVGAAAPVANRRVVVPVKQRSASGSVFMALAMIAVAAAAAYFVVIKPSAGMSSWQSSEGKQMHAEFVQGCNRTAMGRIDCECVFTKISSTPPYDTPKGFLKITEEFERYRQTGNPADIPQLFVDVAMACRR